MLGIKASKKDKPRTAAVAADSIISVLSKIQLLEGVGQEALEEIARNCRYKRFPANSQIFDRKSNSSDIFFVVRGRVRVVNFSLSGREITLDDIVKGGNFGELAAIDGEPRMATVMTLTESLIVAWPRPHFLKALEKYPRISRNTLVYLSKLVRVSAERIMDLSTLGANNRVQADLLRQALASTIKDNESVLSPMPVHGDIASRVSTTRETVARVMNELARKEIIERKKDVLLIRNVEQLKEMVEDVRGE